MANANPNPAGRFRPGQCGNPGGRPKGRTIGARLRELLDSTEIDGRPVPDGKRVADLVAEAILRAAIDGDHKFVTTLLDRTEGRAPDSVQPVEADEQKPRIILPDVDIRYAGGVGPGPPEAGDADGGDA